jgi:putative DNA primase/helicase
VTTPRTRTAKRNNHRPNNWQVAPFYQDSQLVYHEVDKPEKDPVYENPPDWVYERRGQPIPQPVIKAANGELPDYDSGDTGNAVRMAAMYGDTIRYIPQLNVFAIFNGKYWEYDYSGNKILALSKKVVKSYLVDAVKTDDDKLTATLTKHAKNSLNLHRRQAMIELLKAEPGIEVSIEDFDTDLYYLNCRNGTIDLRTGELKKHDKADMITRYINIEYDPNAFSEQWDGFLDKVFNNNEKLIRYIQTCIGMSATADISNMAIFLPYGLGWNGKSTLLNTICYVLGDDYAAHVDPAVFMADERLAGPNEGIANLYKKRLVCATETKEGQKLATDLLKRATGGEKLTHNKKYQHEFMYAPVFKLWLSGNHRETVSDSTDSIWLRIKQIPFDMNFRPGTPGFNSNLKQELSSPDNAQAILTWIVDGAVRWWKAGRKLDEPAIVTSATQEYRQDQDLLHDFLAECCEPTTGAETLAKEIWQVYEKWCKENGKYQLGQHKFYERLREKGYLDHEGNGRKKYYSGIKLLL